MESYINLQNKIMVLVIKINTTKNKYQATFPLT